MAQVVPQRVAKTLHRICQLQRASRSRSFYLTISTWYVHLSLSLFLSLSLSCCRFRFPATCLPANPIDKATNCVCDCCWAHADDFLTIWPEQRATTWANMSRHKARLSKQISRYTRTQQQGSSQMDGPRERAVRWLQYNYATMGDKLRDGREKATKSQSLWHLRSRHARLSQVGCGVGREVDSRGACYVSAHAAAVGDSAEAENGSQSCRTLRSILAARAARELLATPGGLAGDGLMNPAERPETASKPELSPSGNVKWFVVQVKRNKHNFFLIIFYDYYYNNLLCLLLLFWLLSLSLWLWLWLWLPFCVIFAGQQTSNYPGQQALACNRATFVSLYLLLIFCCCP